MKILQAMVLVSGGVAGLAVLGFDVRVSQRPIEPVYVAPQPVYVAQPQPAYVIVAEAPPAPRVVERRVASPSAAHVWIDGYYSWSGRQYVWEAGRWEVPPSGYTVWVAPHYEHDEHGHRYTAGHWQPRDHDAAHEKQPERR